MSNESTQAQMTDKQLQRLCLQWQKRLRLLDWKVTIRFASAKELDGAQGCCNHELYSRTAEIQVITPSEYDASQYPHHPPQNIEDTVVHELLHLHLAPWRAETEAEGAQMEQAIESIAGAFVGMRRKRKSNK